MRHDPSMGLRRLLLPVSYWRQVEFAYVWKQLRDCTGARVLDVGSPKELAFCLARRMNMDVSAIDILDSEISRAARYRPVRRGGTFTKGDVSLSVQDARQLEFDDNSFDALFSVSVVEHIPGEGDSQAIDEFIRVVKPGGLIVITTPFASEARDTFVHEDVYERARRGSEPVFYERHYDQETLRTRLTSRAGATLSDVELWGEGFVRGEHLLRRMGGLRTALSPLEPALAAVCLRRLPSTAARNAMAVFLTLRVTKGAS
jgi:ubiquinone/menaquinone biosynthesis C-methylase UbiE